MRVALSGAVKVLPFGHQVDCGFAIKAEARSAAGGYIIKPNQLKLAGVPELWVRKLTVLGVKDENGKTHKNVCYIKQQFITPLSVR